MTLQNLQQENQVASEARRNPLLTALAAAQVSSKSPSHNNLTINAVEATDLKMSGQTFTRGASKSACASIGGLAVITMMFALSIAANSYVYNALSRTRIWAQGMGGSSGPPLLGSRKARWHTANVTLFSVPRKHLKEDGEVRRSIGEQAAAFLASVALPRAISHRPKLPNCIKFRCQAPLGWPTQNTGSASSCNYPSNSGRSALGKLIGICGQNRRRFQIWKCNPAKMATHGFA